MRIAVFFDRDGTLMEEADYCRDPALVRAIPGAREALARLRAAGILRVIVTNQSGIGRGRITVEEYAAVQAELERQLGGEIDAVYFAPDRPDEAGPRRKPGVGMLEEAARDLEISLERSWFVGDKAIDVECGHNAGMPAVLVRTGYGAQEGDAGADFVANDVVGAVDWILARIEEVGGK